MRLAWFLNPFHLVCSLLLCLHYSESMSDQFFFLKHAWLVTNQTIRVIHTVIVYLNSEAPKCLNSEDQSKWVIIYMKNILSFLVLKKTRWDYPLWASLQFWFIVLSEVASRLRVAIIQSRGARGQTRLPVNMTGSHLKRACQLTKLAYDIHSKRNRHLHDKETFTSHQSRQFVAMESSN